MQPKLSFNSLSTTEIAVFVSVVQAFKDNGITNMLDFVYYLKYNKEPLLKTIGYKFVKDNTDYIIFTMFSKN
jgi:hypothetical protein